MKKCIVFLNLLFLTNPFFAQNPALQWARSFGGTGNEYLSAQVIDPSGNSYTAGISYYSFDADPGVDVFDLSPEQGYIYITKLDASGDFIWAKNMGGEWGNVSAIALDPSGNIYLTGSFDDTSDFDPGTGVFNLICDGNTDAFILKLTDTGEFVWAKSVGGFYSTDIGTALTTDSSGNVIITGRFDGEADFDPGTQIFTLNPTVPNGSDADMFILKLDSSGNFAWAGKIGGVGEDAVSCVKADVAGNVYLSGYYTGTSDFNPGVQAFNMTTAGSSDVFICKLDAFGNFQWAKSIGGPSFEFGNALTLDESGNIYSAGSFSETADFNPGSETSTLTASGGSDSYTLKLNSAGDFVWARRTGGGVRDVANGVAIDGAGSVYTTGGFGGLVDFDSGAGTTILNSADGDAFIVKLSASGDFISVIALGGTSFGTFDWSWTTISIDASENIYLAGNFLTTADFNPGSGVTSLTSNGEWDVFIVKLSQGLITGTANPDYSGGLTIYPNPASDKFTVETPELLNGFVEVYNNLGIRVYSAAVTNENAIVDVCSFAGGIYLVNILNEEGLIASRKIVKL